MQQKISRSFQGVSTLPILVPVNDSEVGDGVATFVHPTSGAQPQVHVVREAELKSDWLQKVQSRRDVDFLVGTTRLKDAYKANDAAMARDAYITLMPFLEEANDLADSPGEHKFADFYSTKLADGLLHWPLHHYSQLISRVLDEARLVWWWPARAYSTLAIYCPTWKSAIILASLLERFRMCPCGRLFIPRKTSAICCSKEHTSYYRLKRWRARRDALKHTRRKA